VPWNAGYVSQLCQGRKQPSPELAAKLDELLGADGALAALGEDEPPGKGISAGRLALATARGDLAATTDLIRRLRASDVETATLEALAGTTDTLCMQYAYRRPAELRSETQQWLSYVGKLLGERVGLREHRELLVTAGWLTLLTGCLEYDSGMAAAAEATRITSQTASAWEQPCPYQPATQSQHHRPEEQTVTDPDFRQFPHGITCLNSKLSTITPSRSSRTAECQPSGQKK
jgi:hypothetical protein